MCETMMLMLQLFCVGMSISLGLILTSSAFAMILKIQDIKFKKCFYIYMIVYLYVLQNL
jgi:hypothetical protein